MKYLPFLLLIVITLGCGNRPTTSNSVPVSQASPTPATVTSTEISLGELATAYDEDKNAADAKYKGKRLEIWGPVGEVTDSKLVFNSMGSITVACQFSESERSNLSSLKGKAVATVVGSNEGLSGSIITFTDCKVLPNKYNKN